MVLQPVDHSGVRPVVHDPGVAIVNIPEPKVALLVASRYHDVLLAGVHLEETFGNMWNTATEFKSVFLKNRLKIFTFRLQAEATI